MVKHALVTVLCMCCPACSRVARCTFDKETVVLLVKHLQMVSYIALLSVTVCQKSE